jgi:hypothetical protein
MKPCRGEYFFVSALSPSVGEVANSLGPLAARTLRTAIEVIE